MINLWIKIKKAFQYPQITATVVVLQAVVLAHAAFLFIKGTRQFPEGLLFITYVVVSAYYWKRYARQKRENPKSNHSH